MAASAELLSAIGRAGVLKRHYPDSPIAIEAERDLAAIRIAEYAQAVVDKAPPLTPRQIDRISLILHGGRR